MTNMAQNGYTEIGDELKQEMAQEENSTSPLRLRRQAIEHATTQFDDRSARVLEIYQRSTSDGRTPPSPEVEEMLENPQLIMEEDGAERFREALMNWDMQRSADGQARSEDLQENPMPVEEMPEDQFTIPQGNAAGGFR